MAIKDQIKKHKYLLLVLNLTFAAIAVIGQVGQNVSLPLWVDATKSFSNPNCTSTPSGVEDADDLYLDDKDNSTGEAPQMDPYFVLTCASFSFVLIFGFCSLVLAVTQFLLNRMLQTDRYQFITLKNDLLFPQWQLMLIGLFDAMNGVFVVFASPSSRTAPFLQAILGNAMIPLTIVFRLLLLRKKPTLLKLLCAIAVVVGLLLSLVPVVGGFDKNSKSGDAVFFSQPVVSRILWPLCFMFGFVPAAVMNVIEEKSLKDTRTINLFYFLFWTSLYQLIVIGLFFWVDIIPEFGFAGGSIEAFGNNYWFAIQCFFGHAGCDYIPSLRAISFISMYVLSYIGGGLLIRYAEGATYLAIVQSLVTPLGALFWSLFEEDNCGHFFFKPNADALTYFSIGGLILMVPAIFLYNIGTFNTLLKLVLRVARCCFGDRTGYTCDTLENLVDRQGNVQDDERKPILTVNEKKQYGGYN